MMDMLKYNPLQGIVISTEILRNGNFMDRELR